MPTSPCGGEPVEAPRLPQALAGVVAVGERGRRHRLGLRGNDGAARGVLEPLGGRVELGPQRSPLLLDRRELGPQARDVGRDPALGALGTQRGELLLGVVRPRALVVGLGGAGAEDVGLGAQLLELGPEAVGVRGVGAQRVGLLRAGAEALDFGAQGVGLLRARAQLVGLGGAGPESVGLLRARAQLVGLGGAGPETLGLGPQRVGLLCPGAQLVVLGPQRVALLAQRLDRRAGLLGVGARGGERVGRAVGVLVVAGGRLDRLLRERGAGLRAARAREVDDDAPADLELGAVEPWDVPALPAERGLPRLRAAGVLRQRAQAAAPAVDVDDQRRAGEAAGHAVPGALELEPGRIDPLEARDLEGDGVLVGHG